MNDTVTKADTTGCGTCGNCGHPLSRIWHEGKIFLEYCPCCNPPRVEDLPGGLI